MTTRLTTSRKCATRILLAAACLVAISGCSTIKGWFGGDDDEKATDPAPLVEFAPSVTVNRLWSADAGRGEGRLGFRQGPAIADGRVYAAAVGSVHAYDLLTGAEQWSYEPAEVEDKPRIRLSGGHGAGDGLVVVGGLDGEVIALDAATGAEKWTAKVGNEVIAAPVVGGGMVFVRSNDGRVTAFDAASGERRWFWSRVMPALTVRGNDGVVLGPGYVFVGNDDGTVAAISMQDGTLIWEQAVAQPEGRSELDRMADIDGTPVLDGAVLYATSFRGQTMAIDAPTGRPLWAHDSGGGGRLGNAADRVVATDRNGTVWAIGKTDGGALWQQPALARRNLGGAAVQGDYAVVGDLDGYLHWLRLSDGQFAAREKTGGEPLRAAPVVADGVLVVQNVDGQLTAFRLN
jgi:outer membrane protein assembly factor BamB